jgi:hypothetical protein
MGDDSSLDGEDGAAGREDRRDGKNRGAGFEVLCSNLVTVLVQASRPTQWAVRILFVLVSFGGHRVQDLNLHVILREQGPAWNKIGERERFLEAFYKAFSVRVDSEKQQRVTSHIKPLEVEREPSNSKHAIIFHPEGFGIRAFSTSATSEQDDVLGGEDTTIRSFAVGGTAIGGQK